VPHLWRYQEFSAWMTASMHDAGGPALTGPFRQMTALARLDKLFDSSAAGRLYGDYLQGGAWQVGLPMPA
jgi:p-hydroxybenzoate 3-monooxygenase